MNSNESVIVIYRPKSSNLMFNCVWLILLRNMMADLDDIQISCDTQRKRSKGINIKYLVTTLCKGSLRGGGGGNIGVGMIL